MLIRALDAYCKQKRIAVKVLQAYLSILLFSAVIHGQTSPTVPKESVLYQFRGLIGDEAEMAYLDHLSIEIMKDPDLLGYILIYSGRDSCLGQAEARALRAKNYLMEVRGTPWDKVMWRHAGRYTGKGVEVFFLVVRRSELVNMNFSYEAPPAGQVIPRCRKGKIYE